jgi:hypothetical protein
LVVLPCTVIKLAHAFSSHFTNSIKVSDPSQPNLVFTLIGSLVALFNSSIMLKAKEVLIIRPEPCQLLTTFFAGHPIFTSIQATSYRSIIFAALTKFSIFFQNICTIRGFSISW